MHAHTHTQSRAFKLMVDGQEATVLCPLADMANHNAELGCTFTKKYNPALREFDICYKEGRGCAAGEELFFKYGEVCAVERSSPPMPGPQG